MLDKETNSINFSKSNTDSTFHCDKAENFQLNQNHNQLGAVKFAIESTENELS